MGQIPKDRENGQNVASFLLFVTKQFDFSTFLNSSEEILFVRL